MTGLDPEFAVSSFVTPDLIRGPAWDRNLLCPSKSGIPDQARDDERGVWQLHTPRWTSHLDRREAPKRKEAVRRLGNERPRSRTRRVISPGAYRSSPSSRTARP